MDSSIAQVEHAYIVYELHKCTDELRKPTDPECET